MIRCRTWLCIQNDREIAGRKYGGSTQYTPQLAEPYSVGEAGIALYGNRRKGCEIRVAWCSQASAGIILGFRDMSKNKGTAMTEMLGTKMR